MPGDMTRFLGLFVREAVQRVDDLRRDLRELEARGPAHELLERLHRHAHSLVGMAGLMHFHEIAETARRAEALAVRLREAAPSERAQQQLVLHGAIEKLALLVHHVAATAPSEDEPRLAVGAMLRRS